MSHATTLQHPFGFGALVHRSILSHSRRPALLPAFVWLGSRKHICVLLIASPNDSQLSDTLAAGILCLTDIFFLQSSPTGRVVRTVLVPCPGPPPCTCSWQPPWCTRAATPPTPPLLPPLLPKLAVLLLPSPALLPPPPKAGGGSRGRQ